MNSNNNLNVASFTNSCYLIIKKIRDTEKRISLKTIGIIAEYNPFHNGHQYLIEEARKASGADYCIVVMSGNFVQRGAPAMADKYVRTQMALLNGADLVLELPVCYAVGSAEYFARGAVSLLDKLGVVQALAFGSECGEIEPLAEAARLLAREEPLFQALLRENLKNGLSFPAARSKSLTQMKDSEAAVLPPELLDSPNNILAVEYCKALRQRNSPIVPMTLRRKGAGFHDVHIADSSLEKAFASATALRNMIRIKKSNEEIAPYVPQNVLPLLAHLTPGMPPVSEEDFSLLLHYKLLLDAPEGFRKYMDVSKPLSDKIRKNLSAYTGYQDFILALKSKDLTYSRISRCLLHILLDITAADIVRYETDDMIYYARMLGFRKSAGKLLHAIKLSSSVPLLSKLADAPSLFAGAASASLLADDAASASLFTDADATSLLDDAAEKPSSNGLDMLRKDIQAAHLYDMIYSVRYGTPKSNEYTRGIVTVS